MDIQSYVCGEWVSGRDPKADLYNAITGERIGAASSGGIDFERVLGHARERGWPALQQMGFHERAARLKSLAQHLADRKETLYGISAWTGATRTDSWVDIEGGIGTLAAYASLARKEMPDGRFLVEGDLEPLSKQGSFAGRHILVPRRGVAVHINAFNFPCWGLLEKLAPCFIAGVPVVVKPASVSCYLTEAMVREIIDSGILPEGSLQLICGGVGDLLDHLDEQDCVTFTGSASTGRKLKTHPNIVSRAIPFNMEADSLNCSILGETVAPGDVEFDLYVKEVAREMSMKAGQKCTAIRRLLVPEDRTDAVIEALKKRLGGIAIGDPAVEGVKMGSLVGRDQVRDVWSSVHALMAEAEPVYGATKDFEVKGADRDKGAFFPLTLLYCGKPLEAEAPHAVEAFGPVGTIMPYRNLEEAAVLAARGRGSLVGSLFTADDGEAARLVMETAAWHGRMLIVNAACAGESTGHGTVMPRLIHGGPGRAGGGEELGGLRGIKHYMQRVALQGSPATLEAITG